MDLTEKLPTMTDRDLNTLLRNAECMAKSDTPKYHTIAVSMLPIVRAEVARRHKTRPLKSGLVRRAKLPRLPGTGCEQR